MTDNLIPNRGSCEHVVGSNV